MSQPLVQNPVPAIPDLPLAVWKNPESLFSKITAITEDYVLFAPATRDDLDATVAAFQSSGTFPEGAKAIPHASIFKVVLNERDTDITVSYRDKKERRSSTYDFADSEEREAFISALKTRVGEHFKETRKVLNPFTASIKPLFAAGVIAFMTWLLRLAAIEIANGGTTDISGRRSGIKRLIFWIIDVIGPTGVLIVGGLALALCILVLVQRVKNPPIFRILKRAR